MDCFVQLQIFGSVLSNNKTDRDHRWDRWYKCSGCPHARPRHEASLFCVVKDLVNSIQNDMMYINIYNIYLASKCFEHIYYIYIYIIFVDRQTSNFETYHTVTNQYVFECVRHNFSQDHPSIIPNFFRFHAQPLGFGGSLSTSIRCAAFGLCRQQTRSFENNHLDSKLKKPWRPAMVMVSYSVQTTRYPRWIS